MTDSIRREEALRSALGRLPLAVVVVDERRVLRPLNTRAARLLQDEGLGTDLLRSRPSHPLSKLVGRILESAEPEEIERTTVVFPSGTRYVVEPSRRSEKGLEGWLVLLIDAAREPAPVVEAHLHRWSLTERERQVALLMTRGCSSAAICAELGIARTTLKTHVRQILSKSNAPTRAAFLAKLLHEGSES